MTTFQLAGMHWRLASILLDDLRADVRRGDVQHARRSAVRLVRQCRALCAVCGAADLGHMALP